MHCEVGVPSINASDSLERRFVASPELLLVFLIF
jgi:hypothetical protein